jgi:4-alpha-glucanotransferase
MTLRPRCSGILLHPTSLPGRYGIGDLGPNAYRWVDTLAAMKQSVWQILPLTPTGIGGSPYQSFSAFAGNPYLISPELLEKEGLLPPGFGHEQHYGDGVEFERVELFKKAMLREAKARFASMASQELKDAYEHFRFKESAWLKDYAEFMAIRDALGGRGLVDWPKELLHRKEPGLSATIRSVSKEVELHTFGQFLFEHQWNALKEYANGKGIRILGDAPIFVSGDSSDVWAQPELFLLDSERRPLAVAGVPPDYFAEDGQHWGNPLYDWKAMKATGYAWWVARLKRQLKQVDEIRLDHFRGFAAAWHIPAKDKTAKNGKWVDGPRADLFETLKRELGGLPIVAEDLGVITPDVDALRTQFGLPGMKVIQFMLGGPENPYWPHNYEANSVAYTGTHDNDTSLGWFHSLNDRDKKTLMDYTGHWFHEPHWECIRLAWASVANVAITPLQDLLGLGSEARMNKPGIAAGNWGWRFKPEQFPHGLIERIGEWTERYRRAPVKPITGEIVEN